MSFNIITNFTKHVLIQRRRRDLSALHHRPCRSYTTLRNQIHHVRNKITPFQHLARFRKSYCSKSLDCTSKGFLAWYLGMLETRPILTKSVSSAVIYAAADVTSQMITMEPSGAWDSLRTMRMASFGLIVLGPSQHFWYHRIASSLPNRDFFSTLKKIALGQVTYAPIINCTFFSFNAALQGENKSEITARLKRDLIPTLLNGVMFWPFCDFFTYKVIPVHLQPLINSSFSYVWSIYLTYMASLKKATHDQIRMCDVSN